MSAFTDLQQFSHCHSIIFSSVHVTVFDAKSNSVSGVANIALGRVTIQVGQRQMLQ